MLTGDLIVSTERLQDKENILVAVSGGSDSLALLHILQAMLGANRLSVATVDHGLRPESAEEAKQVSKIAQSLGLSHETLVWSPGNSSASAAARDGRYELLVRHAVKLGTNIIALGHTLDDQAETILMRSFRMSDESGVRGLSGMTEWSSYETIKLWRPLLNCRRQELRDELEKKTLGWIDDPSNQKLESERVRVRRFLENPMIPFPKTKDIARLASLSGRTRAGLNELVAKNLSERVTWIDNEQLEFEVGETTPRLLVCETLSILIQFVGGGVYGTPRAKLNSLVDATFPKTKTLGHCLITPIGRKFRLQREQRRNGTQLPALTSVAFQRYRPSCDDVVYLAVENLIGRRFCST